MAGSYPNSGALFKNTRATNPKAPQHEGDIEIDADLLRALVGNAKAGKPIKIRLAGWVKDGRNGEFISLKASIPQEKRERQEAPSRDIDDDIPF